MTPTRNILIFTVVLIGLAVRLLFINIAPGGLNQDEASIGYDAWALLNYGIDRWGVSWPIHFISWGSGQNALYAYLAMPFIAIGGLSVTTIRLPAAILGAACLLLFWRLGKREGKNSELIILLVIATSPWHIMASRWALESNAAPAFVLFGTYFLARSKDKPHLFLPLGSALISVSIFAYGTAYFFAPIYLISAFVIIYRQQKMKLTHFSMSVFISLIIATPIIIFLLNNRLGDGHIHLGPFTIPKYPGEARYSGLFLPFAEGGFSQIPENTMKVFQMLLGGHGDGLSWNASPAWGPQYVLLTPFLLIGIVSSLRNGSTTSKIMLAWLVSALLTAFCTSANINRINLIWLPSLWLSAIGIASIPLVHIASRTIHFAIAACGILFIGYYFFNWQKNITDSFYNGLGEAITYTIENVSLDSKIAVTEHSNYMSTMFFSQIPPNTFIETADIPNRNAAFISVKSFDRFTFGVNRRQLVSKDAWIAHKTEIGLFNPSAYQIRTFGDYASIKKNSDSTCAHSLEASEFIGQQDYGSLGINSDVSRNNKRIRLSNNQVISRGLGVHGLSEWGIALPQEQPYSLFVGISMSKSAHCSDGMRFSVYADDKELSSMDLKYGDLEYLQMDIPEKSERIILKTFPNGSNKCDHGAWLTPTINHCSY